MKGSKTAIRIARLLAKGWFAMLALLLMVGSAQASPLIVTNGYFVPDGSKVSFAKRMGGAKGTGNVKSMVGTEVEDSFSPLATFDFSTGELINYFYPDDSEVFDETVPEGFGVAVSGNLVYYTEIDFLFFEIPYGSDGIHIARYNSGAGADDVNVLPNPNPGAGIQDLAFSGGLLWALTGYNGLEYRGSRRLWNRPHHRQCNQGPHHYFPARSRCRWLHRVAGRQLPHQRRSELAHLSGIRSRQRESHRRLVHNLGR